MVQAIALTYVQEGAPLTEAHVAPDRTGFFATIAAGMALLGASFHGITSVDHELKVAATTPSPRTVVWRRCVEDWHGRDCDKHDATAATTTSPDLPARPGRARQTIVADDVIDGQDEKSRGR